MRAQRWLWIWRRSILRMSSTATTLTSRTSRSNTCSAPVSFDPCCWTVVLLVPLTMQPLVSC